MVEGIVRDRDTGKPIAGARVNDWSGQILATDAQGRFRFEGQPKSGPAELTLSAEDQPYVPSTNPVKGKPGLEPIRVDITLKRGAWVRGRVIDRQTGKPVLAALGYYPLVDNPHVKDYPDAQFLERSMPHLPVIATDADGRFRAAVPPGKGLLAVKASEPGYVGARPPRGVAVINSLGFGGGDLSTYNAFVPIDVPTGEGLTVPEIALGTGRVQHVQIVDPNGRPVPGTWIYCFQGAMSEGEPMADASFPFVHANPGQPETLTIVHEERSLGASIDLKGDEPDPLRIALQPTGTVTGHLVHDDGKPRPGVPLVVRHRLIHRGMEIHGDRAGSIVTGPDGRFRIPDLVPGLRYSVTVEDRNAMPSRRSEGYLHAPELVFKPGEVQNWGDVQVKAD